jgi:tetrahydrofolate dehydrogenase/cyclohydrolase-like protein/transposase-like protein DUF772
VFFDGAFLDAFGVRGWPGISPGQLAMVTVLQFAENLTDRQAADAVRGRIDWKYLLGLELSDPGFDFTVLSQFRTRLVDHALQPMVLDIGRDTLMPHTARLLPGGPVADAVLTNVAQRVTALRARGVTASLATILVGSDDANAGYIRIKQRQAAELGFAPHRHLPADTTQDQLVHVIAEFNAGPTVHAVLIQYPVPAHLDYNAALQTLDPDKDVDGMHPLNMGRLALGMPGPLPCTPAGIEALLEPRRVW